MEEIEVRPPGDVGSVAAEDRGRLSHARKDSRNAEPGFSDPSGGSSKRYLIARNASTSTRGCPDVPDTTILILCVPAVDHENW